MNGSRWTAWIVMPPAVAAAGWFWMHQAASRFERLTARPLYGLAGVQYSLPEWGFRYHPGGQQIERWVVTIPTITTLCILLVASIALTFAARARLAVTVARWVYVIVWAVAFLTVAAWHSMNITGVFI